MYKYIYILSTSLIMRLLTLRLGFCIHVCCSLTGAVYQAAHLGKGFKVKTFHIKDANVYPVQVGRIIPVFICTIPTG